MRMHGCHFTENSLACRKWLCNCDVCLYLPGAAGDGPFQGGAAHVYPGAPVIPGQALRLLLPL